MNDKTASLSQEDLMFSVRRNAQLVEQVLLWLSR